MSQLSFPRTFVFTNVVFFNILFFALFVTPLTGSKNFARQLVSWFFFTETCAHLVNNPQSLCCKGSIQKHIHNHHRESWVCFVSGARNSIQVIPEKTLPNKWNVTIKHHHWLCLTPSFQLVKGIRYTITVELSNTQCKKSTMLRTCDFYPEAHQLKVGI